MSDKILLHVYYGEGVILHGPNGVSLDQFNCVERWVTRPGEKSCTALQNWLMRGFQLNTATHKLNIMAMVSRVNEGYFWELIPINSTSTWKRYVQFALDRGQPLTLFVQTEVVQYEEEERAEASEEGRESEEPQGVDDGANEEGDAIVGMQTCLSGVADEGELFPEIVEEMELESHETEDLGDEDSSDEENEPSCTPLPIPAEWTNMNTESLVVDDRQNAPWEFHDNVVSQGAIYASKEAVKDAVKRWSFSIRRSFVVHRATSKLYEVRCPRSECPFCVHASEGKWTKQ